MCVCVKWECKCPNSVWGMDFTRNLLDICMFICQSVIFGELCFCCSISAPFITNWWSFPLSTLSRLNVSAARVPCHYFHYRYVCVFSFRFMYIRDTLSLTHTHQPTKKNRAFFESSQQIAANMKYSRHINRWFPIKSGNLTSVSTLWGSCKHIA